jgi:Rrf2 family protein
LAYIAANSDGEPVAFAEILAYLRAYSPQLSLSPGYIGKIFQDVSRSGLTQAVSGPRGGYRLNRPAAEISLLEVVETLEGPLLSECCLLSVGQCSQQECGVRDVVHEAESALIGFFERETVASLVEKMAFPDRAVITAHRNRADSEMRRPGE